MAAKIMIELMERSREAMCYPFLLEGLLRHGELVTTSDHLYALIRVLVTVPFNSFISNVRPLDAEIVQ